MIKAKNIYLDKKSRFFKSRKRALTNAGYSITNIGIYCVELTLDN